MLQILIDADACPVVRIVEKIAKENKILVTILCDTSHSMDSDYGVAAMALENQQEDKNDISGR